MITYSLPSLALMGNPTWIEIVTDNHIATPGALGVYELQFQAVPADNDTMLWTWASGSVNLTFTFTPSPGESATNIPNTLNSVQDFITGELIPALNAFQYLRRYYEFALVGTDTLQITTLQKDDRYDLSVQPSTGFAQYATNVAPVTEVPALNLRLSTLFYTQVPGQDAEKISLSLKPVGDTALLDISQFLSRETYLPPALNTGTSPINQDEQLVVAWLEAAEQSSNQGQQSSKTIRSNDMYFLPGGTSVQDYKSIDLPGIMADINGSNSLLSVLPTTRYLAPGTPHWMTVGNFVQQADCKIELELHYQDQTTEKVLLHSITSLPIYSIRAFPVTWDLALQKASAGKTLHHFKARAYLEDLSSEIDLSPTLTFYKDQRIAQEETILAYRNALGFWETFRAIGQLIHLATGQKKYEQMKMPPAGYNAVYRAARPGNYERYESWEVHTGFLPEYQLVAVQDLLMSNEVRWLRDGKQIPVRVDDIDDEVGRSRSHKANGLTLKIRELENSKYYSHGQYSV